MSPIALGLDLILAILLVSALVVGLRLNARLKTLQAGQAGFVKAALELNQAAARADAGLAALRAAAEEVHDGLVTRIETARQLAAKLEGAAERAPQAAVAALGVPKPAAAEAEVETVIRPAPAPIRFTPRPVKSAIRDMDDDLFEAPGGGGPPAQRSPGRIAR
jgi:hypothetical protein